MIIPIIHTQMNKLGKHFFLLLLSTSYLIESSFFSPNMEQEPNITLLKEDNKLFFNDS